MNDDELQDEPQGEFADDQPDWQMEQPPFGAMIDLPYEAGDANPSDINYGDIGQPYDPNQDWREAQMQYLANQYGEYGPAPSNGTWDEEATDG